MEPKMFTLFPRLPIELRHAIWALAIRPKQPSAHFFTVFESSNDDEWSALSQHSISHPYQHRSSLAAPEIPAITNDDSQQRQFSWTQGNRSAYMIDRGLWTACRESREVMERRFRVAEWDIERDAWIYREDFDEEPLDAPATTSFMSDGEQQCCLTYPKTDLFLLRPFNATTADWRGLDSEVHIFNETQRFHVGHVAIDYDPEWDAQFISGYKSGWSDGAIGWAMRAATDHLEWAKNLWFVDYRIRRSPDGVQPMVEGRRQFHGNGCRLTEVRDGDAGWELDHDGDVFDFLRELWYEVDDFFRQREISPDWPPEIPHDDAPDVGVLAYEEC